jgi:hypothetical protein
MFEKDDPLDLILEEIARIHKIRGSVHGDYHHGRVIMLEAADQLDYNVGRALKTMRRARESFEEESEIDRRFNSFKAKWALMDAYQFGDQEKGLEKELHEAIREGEYDLCPPILAKLERLMDQDVADNIEIGLQLEVAKPEIQLGRGTTLSVLMHNHSAFPIQVEALVGRSSQASINVLDFYKGEMRPNDDRNFQINVIPKVEGDIPVEIEATIENDSRMLRIKKGFSLKVEVPAQVVQVVQVMTPNEMQYAKQSPIVPRTQTPSSFDPQALVVSGTVDQWALCIVTFAKGRGPIDLAGMVQADPNFIRSDGYANMFKALLVMAYDRSIDWGAWFNEAGFIGEDYTRRCTRLLYRMATSPDRSIELEMDGSIGSSNIENLIGAMLIASGEIRREERSRRAWKVEGEIDGSRFSLSVEKAVIKDETGKAKAATFRIVPSG